MPGPIRLVHQGERHVDTTRERSVSFAPPETRLPPHRSLERQPIPVGPGRPPDAAPPWSGPLRDEASGYPIQLAKVQPPVLRDETLERPRLLDWLRIKVHGRVVLILADAGYGKTTLLADFSRRSRLRTLWYRLDDDDRDWVSLMHHLVAAGREHVPDFAPDTAALLARTGIGGPAREEVLDAFLRELPSIATHGLVLILDDFHVVDDAPDVRHIARAMLERGPERLTLVVASRRLPTVPLARLRAAGEVAELGTDELRFDLAETTQLFNETYGRRLESDVLVDLARRTEGWAASLHLVQAALRDRSPVEIRRFVRSMTGADHELYDYLAEEVVGDLSEELQRFLMETSILQVVVPDLAEIATGRDAGAVARLTTTAERLTLLSRTSRGPRTQPRYHPLVREFLEARLATMDGLEAVAERHRRVAAAAVSIDWRTAAYHYREAGDIAEMLDVVGDAIPTIMGNGQYALAESFIGSVDAERRPARFDLILSRVDMQQGDYDAAIAASLALLDAPETDSVERDHALLNLVTLYLNYGDGDRAIGYAEQLRSSTSDHNLRLIAEAGVLTVQAASDGDLDAYRRHLTSMAKSQYPASIHHFGVTMLNLAMAALQQDDLDAVLEYASQALDAFETTSSRMERTSALSARAVALARRGEVDVAAELVEGAAAEYADPDLLIEAAQFQDFYGAPAAYEMYIDWAIRQPNLTISHRRSLAMAQARHAARLGDSLGAEKVLQGVSLGPWTGICFAAQRLVTAAYVSLRRGDSSAASMLQDAMSLAIRQRAHYWHSSARLLSAFSGVEADLSGAVIRDGDWAPWHLTEVAELLVPRLHELTPEADERLLRSATLHSSRWRHVLREHLDGGQRSDPSRVKAAALLEAIGETQDVPRLRGVAKELRRTPGTAGLGRNLARRLANPVFIEDQGRVTLLVGTRTVAPSEVRRKVLALVCFLITRPQLSSTRDQVLEALWPDLDPMTAVNSLNQTLYFLRRVLELEYVEDLSPGYIHHDSDVIWLDLDLVSSRSIECGAIIRGMPRHPSPDDVDELVKAYEGRFALDFEYEEWASAYRDSLHAAYLDIVERSVLADMRTGHNERGIRVARRALEIDSSAEQIEVTLLRLYRLVGAHAAAAEQYAHYASVMRDELGIEPPPLESL